MAVAWLEGESGALLTFPEPLPPAIAQRIASGLLKRVPPPGTRSPAPEPAVPAAGRTEPQERPFAEGAGADEPPPLDGATKAEMVGYAVRHGMTKSRAERMSKAQLRFAIAKGR